MRKKLYVVFVNFTVYIIFLDIARETIAFFEKIY